MRRKLVEPPRGAEASGLLARPEVRPPLRAARQRQGDAENLKGDSFQHHGGCWEAFHIFAYCGLVGNPHLAARIYFFAALPMSTKTLTGSWTLNLLVAVVTPSGPEWPAHTRGAGKNHCSGKHAVWTLFWPSYSGSEEKRGRYSRGRVFLAWPLGGFRQNYKPPILHPSTTFL